MVHRPGHGVTVSMMFRALIVEPALLPRLLAVEDLIEPARQKAESYVAAHAVTLFARVRCDSPLGRLPVGTAGDLGYFATAAAHGDVAG